jgi:CMP-N-acetylneuraminic acid synthetase
MNNIAIIPARGGSKGVHRKNIKTIAGKPLVVWSIDTCLEAKEVDAVVVSTDDDEIYNIAKSYGAIPYMRPEHLGYDNVHSVHVVLDYLTYCKKEGIIIDRVAMVLPTTPLKTEEDIDRAFSIFDDSCDSVIGVKEYDRPISCIRKLVGNNIVPVVEINNFETQRQDMKDKLYEVNGSIYISTPDNILARKSFHKGKIKPCVMNNINSIDVNNEDDLRVAETMLWDRQKNAQNAK